MIAGECNFEEEQGDNFYVPLVWMDENEKRVPLTGYTARMQLRASADSEEIVLELNTENDRIVIDDTEDEETILLQITAEDMAAIPAGTYKYDLEMVNGDDFTTKIIKGKFKVVAEVTRPEVEEDE
jgi:hypothetical protein